VRASSRSLPGWNWNPRPLSSIGWSTRKPTIPDVRPLSWPSSEPSERGPAGTGRRVVSEHAPPEIGVRHRSVEASPCPCATSRRHCTPPGHSGCRKNTRLSRTGELGSKARSHKVCGPVAFSVRDTSGWRRPTCTALATTATISVTRISDWLAGSPRDASRTSAFARLLATPVAA
jgi:hypothetical protein